MSESETTLTVGDRVTDADQQRSPAQVVELPGTTAAEHEIPAIDQTVAEANPDHPPDAPVVGIKFERRRDGVPAGPTYHYPASRLKPVSNEWEPPEPKTDAQLEREETIEQNRDAFEMFRHAAFKLAKYPENSREYFERAYDPGVQPETRGGCRYTREDDYRPNNADALVCWECNGGGRRPRKLRAGDDVPYDAPCRAEGFRGPRRTFKTWFGEEIVAGNEDPRLTREVEKAAEPNPDFSRLQWTARNLTHDDESFRRSAVVRIAYEATVGGLLDEDYNHSRACAYLRDLGVDTDALLPGGDPYVGSGGESR